MEAADIEFFRARDRRRKVAYAIACVSIVAVVITLSLCLSPIANPGNIEMIALGIVQAVIGVTIFSFAIVHYVCKASVERERRRRCIAGGFDPDAYWSPRVAIVYLEKPLRRGRVHAVVGGAGVSSGARLGKVHPSALARVLGKAVLYGGSLQPGQPLVFLVKEPPRSTAMCPVLVCEDSS